jgi:predicted peptidase
MSTVVSSFDSQGYHRNFMLHLPLGFDSAQPPLDGQEATRWPVLIYLHGAGGGTFFTHSKKSLKSVGMQFAARTFVVMTPRCEWSWQETPSEWVVELIQAFRAHDWIDYRRMYLTGCSMGGMGVWELGARRPELFAAISPVAAHHKTENTPRIAQQLMATPIYAVHDTTDATCPLAPEEALWKLFEESGHHDFRTLRTTGVEHCKIHEQAYCVDEHLYRWFLERRTPLMSHNDG